MLFKNANIFTIILNINYKVKSVLPNHVFKIESNSRLVSHFHSYTTRE